MDIYNDPIDKTALIFNYISSYDNNNYHEVMVEVKSGCFSGKHSFSLYLSFVQDLISFCESKWNEIGAAFILRDGDSESFLQFTNLTNGHVKINGQVGSNACNHLKFTYLVDQTCYTNIIRFWEQYI